MCSSRARQRSQIWPLPLRGVEARRSELLTSGPSRLERGALERRALERGVPERRALEPREFERRRREIVRGFTLSPTPSIKASARCRRHRSIVPSHRF